MSAKNHKQWKIPAFEQGDYVDSRIYSDQNIFDEEQYNGRPHDVSKES